MAHGPVARVDAKALGHGKEDEEDGSKDSNEGHHEPREQPGTNIFVCLYIHMVYMVIYGHISTCMAYMS